MALPNPYAGRTGRNALEQRPYSTAYANAVRALAGGAPSTVQRTASGSRVPGYAGSTGATATPTPGYAGSSSAGAVTAPPPSAPGVAPITVTSGPVAPITTSTAPPPGSGGGPGGGGGPGSTSSADPLLNYGNGILGPVGASYIFGDPAAMLSNQLGGASGGLYNMLEPLGQYANSFFALMNPQGGQETNAQGIDFMNKFWQGAQTPGNFFNYDALMGSLLNPTGWLEQGLGDANLDPAGQASAFSAMYEPIVRATQHPFFQKAMMAAMDNAQTEYLGQAAQGNIQPFTEFVQGRLPNLIT